MDYILKNKRLIVSFVFVLIWTVLLWGFKNTSEAKTIIEKNISKVKVMKTTFIYSNPDYEFSHYPRAIKLKNGDLLATFITSGGFPIYKSSNNGDSWELITKFHIENYNLQPDITCPALYILPKDLAGEKAGTIFLAFTYNVSTEDTIQIFKSIDNGISWVKQSSLAPGKNDHVTWEPEFNISSDGKLVCYYSDERQPGYSQCLAHEISEDGGLTWKDWKIDVGIKDNNSRPGMPRVQRLKNGKYIMAFEDIHSALDGAIRYKLSQDGINWGVASDYGRVVQSVKGVYAANTPEIGYLDDGSKNGILFVRGMLDTHAANKIFTNSNNGDGTWNEVDAPTKILKVSEKQGGYSGTLLQLDKKTLFEINSTYSFKRKSDEIICGKIKITP